LRVPPGSQGDCSHKAIRFDATDIVPLAGGSSPTIIFASIVLPLPTGPEQITIDPLGISRLTFVSSGGIEAVV